MNPEQKEELGIMIDDVINHTKDAFEILEKAKKELEQICEIMKKEKLDVFYVRCGRFVINQMLNNQVNVLKDLQRAENNIINIKVEE